MLNDRPGVRFVPQSSFGHHQGATAGLYADASPKWPDSIALKVILRSRAGSENRILWLQSPRWVRHRGRLQAPGHAGRLDRSGQCQVRHANPGLVRRDDAAALKAERLDLQPLRLDGVAASAVTIANGTYPFPIRICALLPREPTPAAARFVAHLRSAAGKAIVELFGATPTE